MSFSIVIPCKNEEERIGSLLMDLVNFGLQDNEVIIADAGSTDSTLSIINSFKSGWFTNLKVIEGGLPAKGRNEGCRAASNDYVLFLDADVRLTSKFDSDRLERWIEEGRFKIISTTPRYRGEPDLKASILYSLNRFTTHFISLSNPFAIGAFTMVHKDTFLEMGGYDEEVKHTEDFLLSRNYSAYDFYLFDGWITQDNRRFKKFGYWNMVKLMWKNWLNRNNRDHYLRDIGYW
jgi:glycosyltransferase involved in cell wall biosynthesis